MRVWIGWENNLKLRATPLEGNIIYSLSCMTNTLVFHMFWWCFANIHLRHRNLSTFQILVEYFWSPRQRKSRESSRKVFIWVDFAKILSLTVSAVGSPNFSIFAQTETPLESPRGIVQNVFLQNSIRSPFEDLTSGHLFCMEWTIFVQSLGFDVCISSFMYLLRSSTFSSFPLD